MIAPVVVRLGSELRRRRRSWLGIALILGILAGAVFAIVAGARRTDSAYPRFLDSVAAYDVGVFRFAVQEGFASIDFDRVAALPQVADSVKIRFFSNDEIGVEASTDPDWGVTTSRVKILEGRAANPSDPEEVTVGFLTAREGHEVGDVLEVSLRDEADPSEPVPVRLRIVGVHAAAGEFPPVLGSMSSFRGTRAFAARHASMVVPEGLGLRVKPGEDPAAVAKAIAELGGGQVVLPFLQSDHADNVQRSFHLQAVALWLLGAFAGSGVLLVLGQTFRRQAVLEATEHPTLRALGMTHGQLVTTTMIRSVLIASGAAAVAVGIALAASPLFPTGIARIAEPHPGFAADLVVLLAGPAALIAAIALITLPSAVGAARRSADAAGLPQLTDPVSEPSLADRLSRAGLSTTVVAGARMTLEPGRGRTAMPVRTTVAGVMLGIAALASALSFDASLTHLIETPEEYGLRWDAVVTVPFGTDARPLQRSVLQSTGVADVAAGSIGIPLEIDGTRVDALGIESARGSGLMRLLEGRVPQAPDEIALGSNTLEAVGKRIGDQASVAITGTPARTFRIVGRGVTPPIGDHGHFGEGAFMEYAGLLHIFPEGPPPDILFVRFEPGTDTGTGIEELRRLIAAPALGITVAAPDLPGDLVNFGRVQNLPVILAGLLALLASATLGHALITSVTRRRRDLAILKTLGFVRGQVRAAVAWHATMIAALAVALGVPLGIVGGRALWTLFANELGVLPSARSDLTRNLLVAPAAILLANAIALWPGRSAARTRPAQVLRTE